MHASTGIVYVLKRFVGLTTSVIGHHMRNMCTCPIIPCGGLFFEKVVCHLSSRLCRIGRGSSRSLYNIYSLCTQQSSHHSHSRQSLQFVQYSQYVHLTHSAQPLQFLKCSVPTVSVPQSLWRPYTVMCFDSFLDYSKIFVRAYGYCLRTWCITYESTNIHSTVARLCRLRSIYFCKGD